MRKLGSVQVTGSGARIRSPDDHGVILRPPHLPAQIAGQGALRACHSGGVGVMGTTQDHRREAEECVAMAKVAADRTDKALWMTLAQSWARMAEDAAQASLAPAEQPDEAADDEEEGGAVILEMPLPDRD